jgi:hypothetical protein
MNVTDLRKNFPPTTEIPRPLLLLLEFQNSIRGGYYSGSFQLRDSGAERLVAWFAEFVAPSSNFAIFGAGGSGSLYGYWLYEQHTIETAPIIYLDSESSGNTVLANNIEDFFALLSIGMHEVGAGMMRPHGYGATLQIDDNLLRFREWLHDNFSISVTNNGVQIIEAARASHPDFDDWINQWTEYKE